MGIPVCGERTRVWDFHTLKLGELYLQFVFYFYQRLSSRRRKCTLQKETESSSSHRWSFGTYQEVNGLWTTGNSCFVPVYSPRNWQTIVVRYTTSSKNHNLPSNPLRSFQSVCTTKWTYENIGTRTSLLERMTKTDSLNHFVGEIG